MHEQLGQVLDNMLPKDQKEPSCHLWRVGNKNRMSGAKAGYFVCSPYSTSSKGRANHLRCPSSLTSGHTLTLTPHKEQLTTPLRKHARGSVTCFRSPHCCSRGPSNVLPEFRNWPLVKKELGGGPVKSHSESQPGCIWNKCPIPVFRVHIALVRAFLIISAHCSLTKRPTGPLFIDTFFSRFLCICTSALLSDACLKYHSGDCILEIKSW